MKGLRHHSGFVRLWTASTVSAFGTAVTAVALQVLVVTNLHGSAADVGLVNAARLVPYALTGLFVGALVDRYPRRPVLVVSDLGRGVVLCVIPVLALVGMLRLPEVVVFMVAFGALSLVNDAAFQSFLPRLAPRALLTRANARLDQSATVAQTSGPVLGGGLVAMLGAPIAVVVDAASYVASGLAIWAIRTPEPAPPDTRAGRRGLPHEVVEGLAWVYRHRMLSPLALSTHAWFLFSGVLGAVLAPYALRVLHLGALGLGVAMALTGVGGLAGSLASGWLGRWAGVGPAVAASRAVEGAGVALVAVAALTPSPWPAWALVGAGQLMFGIGMGAENPNEMGYRQGVTPDRLQGRANATMRSLNRAMVVIAAPLGGVFADVAGYGPALWLVAGGFLAGAIALWASPFRRARNEDAGGV